MMELKWRIVAGEMARYIQGDEYAVTCMEVLRIMQGTRGDNALVAAVRGTVIEAKDAAARKAAAVDADARKAAEERAEAKAAAARKAAGKGVEELGVEFAASARKAAAAGSEFSEAENTKAYKSRKAADTSRRRWQERDSRKTAVDRQENESRRGEEKAVAWDSRGALVQVANLLNR